MLRRHDLTMKAVAAGTCFIDEMHQWMPPTKLAQHAGDRVWRVGDFAPEPDLARATGIRHSHRDRIFMDIKAHKCAIILTWFVSLVREALRSVATLVSIYTSWRRTTDRRQPPYKPVIPSVATGQGGCR